MSSYQPMSAPPPEGRGQQPAEAPSSIRNAVNIVWALVALSVLSTVLTFLYVDELVDASGTDLSASQQDAARVGVIAGGVVVLLVFGALWVVLGIFLRKGKNWARIVLTVLTGLGLLFGLFSLVGGGQPAVLLVVAVIQLALQAALLFFMWQKDASAYIQASR